MIGHESDRFPISDIALLSLATVAAVGFSPLGILLGNHQLETALGAAGVGAAGGIVYRYSRELGDMTDNILKITRRGRERLMKWGNLLRPSLEIGIIGAVSGYVIAGAKGALIGCTIGVFDYLANESATADHLN